MNEGGETVLSVLDADVPAEPNVRIDSDDRLTVDKVATSSLSIPVREKHRRFSSEPTSQVRTQSFDEIVLDSDLSDGSRYQDAESRQVDGSVTESQSSEAVPTFSDSLIDIECDDEGSSNISQPPNFFSDTVLIPQKFTTTLMTSMDETCQITSPITRMSNYGGLFSSTNRSTPCLAKPSAFDQERDKVNGDESSSNMFDDELESAVGSFESVPDAVEELVVTSENSSSEYHLGIGMDRLARTNLSTSASSLFGSRNMKVSEAALNTQLENDGHEEFSTDSPLRNAHFDQQAEVDLSTSRSMSRSSEGRVDLGAGSTKLHDPIMEKALESLNFLGFWRWALCFCVVNFDLEIGQAIEYIYPPIELSDAERKTIGQLTRRLYSAREAIPLNYHRINVANPHSSTSISDQSKYNMAIDTDDYTYGYVFFRQQKDSEIRRGFFQKSLVLLSPHPWPGLFKHVMSTIGPKFMTLLTEERNRERSSNSLSPTTAPSSGISQSSAYSATTPASRRLLEQAASDISQWQSPPSSSSPNSAYQPITITLSFLNSITSFSLPPSPRFAQLFELPSNRYQMTNSSKMLPRTTASKSANTSSIDLISSSASLPSTLSTSALHISESHQPQTPIIACPGRFYDLFSRALELSWVCWELMMLGEPILVVAETPKGSSDVVWGLVELIKPIPFGGDFRPYFTIQDSDFKGISARNKVPPTATVIGTTNPVFMKLLHHWPHILRASRFTSMTHPPNSSPKQPRTPILQGSTASAAKDPVNGRIAIGGGMPIPGSGIPMGAGFPIPTSPESLAKTMLSVRNLSPSPRSSQDGDSLGKTPNSPSSTVKSLISSLSRSRTSTSGGQLTTHAGAGSGYLSSTAESSQVVIESVIESLSTKYKPFLLKDKKLLKEIVEVAIRGSSSITLDNMIRRHFVELTDRFIQPLNRYFDGLVVGSPVNMSLSHLRIKPEIRAFKQATFLKSLETSEFSFSNSTISIERSSSMTPTACLFPSTTEELNISVEIKKAPVSGLHWYSWESDFALVNTATFPYAKDTRSTTALNLSVFFKVPVLTSHMRTVLSIEPVAISAPFEEKAHELTPEEWPEIVAMCSLDESLKITSPWLHPTASMFPSSDIISDFNWVALTIGVQVS
ncbi:Protein dennd6a [Blyttiomyces sp. JEL0837]|nr:Protein dennd6a [Blyttiomyces sp. JEL0837]